MKRPVTIIWSEKDDMYLGRIWGESKDYLGESYESVGRQLDEVEDGLQ